MVVVVVGGGDRRSGGATIDHCIINSQAMGLGMEIGVGEGRKGGCVYGKWGVRV